ncbi:MAG: DMT family transporter [Acidimicrobiales bacterium]|nr:DMT family transporter [Acidimicrobiales bacterium]
MVVLAALGSSLLYALASVLQHRSAVAAKGRPLRVGFVVELAARPLWIGGMAADAAGYGLQFYALSRGSLVLVQPLLVSGVLFALPLSGALSQRRLTAFEWTGAAAVVAGLSLFLVIGNPGSGGQQVTMLGWILVAVTTGVPVLALVGVAARQPSGVLRAVLLACATGIDYGVAAALTKTTAAQLDRGLVHTVLSWDVYALVACAVVGLVLGQSAFQAGPLRASMPALTVVDPVVSVLIGALAFGEPLSASGAAPVFEVLGLVVMTLGVTALCRAPVVSGEPGAGAGGAGGDQRIHPMADA